MSPAASYRTMGEAETDYVQDLATRWQSYSFVSGGVGLVLGIIAASMRGYVAHGFAMVGPAVAYGGATALIGSGLAGFAVLQAVARRLNRDLEAARVETVREGGRAVAVREYVRVETAEGPFLLRKADWERLALPVGELGSVTLEYTPVSRVVLTVNGSAVYA